MNAWKRRTTVKLVGSGGENIFCTDPKPTMRKSRDIVITISITVHCCMRIVSASSYTVNTRRWRRRQRRRRRRVCARAQEEISRGSVCNDRLNLIGPFNVGVPNGEFSQSAVRKHTYIEEEEEKRNMPTTRPWCTRVRVFFPCLYVQDKLALAHHPRGRLLYYTNECIGRFFFFTHLYHQLI